MSQEPPINANHIEYDPKFLAWVGWCQKALGSNPSPAVISQAGILISQLFLDEIEPLLESGCCQTLALVDQGLVSNA